MYFKTRGEVFIEMIGNYNISDLMFIFFPIFQFFIEEFELINQLFKHGDLDKPTHFKLERIEECISIFLCGGDILYLFFREELRHLTLVHYCWLGHRSMFVILKLYF